VSFLRPQNVLETYVRVKRLAASLPGSKLACCNWRRRAVMCRIRWTSETWTESARTRCQAVGSSTTHFQVDSALFPG